MRVLFAVFLLLAITVVFLPHPATAATTDCQKTTCSASFQRTISTNPWGVTSVNDYVNLTSTVPVTHLTIGIPASVSDDLRLALATAQGVNLQISKQNPTPGQHYTTLNIQFPTSETKFVFNVTTVFPAYSHMAHRTASHSKPTRSRASTAPTTLLAPR